MTDEAVPATRSATAISDALRWKSARTASVLSILHAVRGVFWAATSPIDRLESQVMTTSKQANEPVTGDDQLPPDADADLRGSLAALRRAALRARQIAEQTGTDLIVVRAGQVVRVPPQPKTTP